MPVLAWLLAKAVRRTPRSYWASILRICGVGLLIGTGLWFITGDIDKAGFTLRMAGGWRGAIVAIIGGAAALLAAQRLTRPSGPPA